MKINFIGLYCLVSILILCTNSINELLLSLEYQIWYQSLYLDDVNDNGLKTNREVKTKYGDLIFRIKIFQLFF